MNRLVLLVGSALIALVLAACGQNAPKQAQPQQAPKMRQQVAPVAEPPAAPAAAAPAAEPAAPAAAAPAMEENQ